MTDNVIRVGRDDSGTMWVGMYLMEEGWNKLSREYYTRGGALKAARLAYKEYRNPRPNPAELKQRKKNEREARKRNESWREYGE